MLSSIVSILSSLLLLIPILISAEEIEHICDDRYFEVYYSLREGCNYEASLNEFYTHLNDYAQNTNIWISNANFTGPSDDDGGSSLPANNAFFKEFSMLPGTLMSCYESSPRSAPLLELFPRTVVDERSCIAGACAFEAQSKAVVKCLTTAMYLKEIS
ncbi:hypothetical protein BJ508DRAFT_312662 [Ascobolus immersus RN42]|uniref:Uncharacterized protein n=1 Tax=Ascobolus immersus RN42 TaxID=1160509 RepID=A0A3N4HRM8_ASCIM|nr:hypothetical protein BJ508DRAFT_312662 [Ascobolus immersus RN42]